jgi:N-acetylornithine carbamoyltransferase
VKHLLSSRFLGEADFERILARAEEFRGGARSRALAGLHVGLVFFNPSLRTRVSMEVAAARLGGTPVVLSVGGDAWAMEYREGAVMNGAAAEHLREGAGVLGRYCDLLGVRSFAEGRDWEDDRREPVLSGFAEFSGVPVVNLESALDHPCQAIADVMTLRQRLGSMRGRKVVLTWAYHPRALPMAVPNAFLLAASRLGAALKLARPAGYDLDPEILSAVEGFSRHSGGSFEILDRFDPAFDGAEAIYAKSWGSLSDYGRSDAEAARRIALSGWRVTEARMARGRDAFFMHCLPVRRNVVVDDAVLDGPRSAVLDQAENRLYAQQAILEWMADGLSATAHGRPQPANGGDPQ